MRVYYTSVILELSPRLPLYRYTGRYIRVDLYVTRDIRDSFDVEKHPSEIVYSFGHEVSAMAGLTLNLWDCRFLSVKPCCIYSVVRGTK